MVEEKPRFDSKLKEVQKQVSRISEIVLALLNPRKKTIDHHKAWCIENALHVTPKS